MPFVQPFVQPPFVRVAQGCRQWSIDDAKSERHKLELWLQFMVLHWEDLGIF